MNLRDPQTQKKLLVVLLPLVAAVGYYQFIHAPRALEVESLEMRVESLNSQNTAMRTVVGQYGEDLERRLAIFQEHVSQLEQLIPSREDVPVLINMISARAYDHGVELMRLQPGGENAGEFYSHQSFQMEVTGNYHSIAEYLTSIGSLPRIVRSSGVRLSRAPDAVDTDGGPILQAAFLIETYVMPVPGEAEVQNATS
jgi:type IV pilus assembly protein PilO